MDILVIAPCRITSNASAGSETINMYIKYLSYFGHTVDVIALTEGKYRKNGITYHALGESYIGERRIDKIVKGAGWLFWPQNKYLYKTNRNFRSTLRRMMKKMKKQGYSPDIVILEMASILLLFRLVRKIFPTALLSADVHDIAYMGSERRAKLEQSRFRGLIRKRYIKYARRNEVRALEGVDLITPHNPDNIDLLKENEALRRKRYFHLVPYYEDKFEHNDNEYTYDILFYGLMRRFDNYMSAEWFIDSVMPKLPPQFRLIIMGGNPPKRLYDRASEKIVITGFVDEATVKYYFENSFCMVVPLLTGSGIKTKVLAALSAGLPVLTNRIGIEGIPATPGRDYIHCESADDYIEAFCGLKGEEYQRLCKNSRVLMNDAFNKERCAKQYNRILESLCRQ